MAFVRAVGDSKEKSVKSSKLTVAPAPPPPPPPPAPPIGASKKGNCGDTVWKPLSECEKGPGSGALNTKTEGITSLADCVAKVKTCKNANCEDLIIIERTRSER